VLTACAFPRDHKQDADHNTKANLLGATILIDFAWFETQQS
jgi:hypothetical protein